MILVRTCSAIDPAPGVPRIPLKADRFQLAKKRWRARASDGQEFGFELETPLAHGSIFHAGENGVYVMEQAGETVLSLVIPEDSQAAAELGWKLGNLHVPIQVHEGQVWVADEPGMRQNLERQHLAYTAQEAVFVPLRAGYGHSHSHDHEHSHGHDHEHHHGAH